MKNAYPTLLRQFIKGTFFLFLFCFFQNNAKSSHIVGGALTYVYNGGDSYTVTLKLYRDCCPTCAAFPASAPITVLQADGSAFTPSRNFTLVAGATIPVPAVLPPCATAPNPSPCAEERTYSATVNLPAAPGGMHLYYSVCCRNASVVNIATPGTIGETFYTYIPCYRKVWVEDFTLANGTIVDAGPTAWSRTIVGVAPIPTAQVNANQFEVISQNSAVTSNVVWASQVINIAAYPSGVNLSVNYSEPAGGTLENSDSISVLYSLNGAAPVMFPNNGFRINDFNGNVFATATGLVGTTIQVFVRVTYGANSPNDEIYRFDMVSVYDNTFMVNNSPTYNNLPPLLLCANNPFSLDHSATDIDGDSLVYTMYTPYTNAAPVITDNVAVMTNVTWLAGYSATSPFNSGGPGVTLNSSTGMLTGVANTLGQYVFGVKCSEYRNGVLITEMTRDYEVNTVVCPPFVPPAPTAGSNSPVCEGGTLNLTASTVSGATYNWTGPNGFTSTQQNPTITGVTLAAAGTYSVTATVSGCTGPAGTTTVTVNPTPAAPTAGSNSPLCVGQTLNLTASNIAGATYSWTGPGGFTSALQNPSITNVQLTNAGVYTVTATVSGCTSAGGTTNVTVNPVPAAPTASNNGPLCEGQTLNLTASNIAGATYSWTGPGGFTSALQNPSIPNVLVANAGVYTVTATVGGCTGPGGTTTVTINATPAAPTAGSNSPICAGQTLNLTASNIAGATYSWTGPGGYTSSAQNPTRPAATVAMSGVYSVTATVGGCTGPAGTVNVTVNPTPAAPTASSNSPVCEGSTINLFSNTVAGATYSWTGPGGFTSALEDPTRPGATVAMSGVYSVTVTVAGCTSAAGTTNVTVNPIPAAPTASSNSPVCAGQTINLFSNTVAGATYSWTGPGGFTSALEDPTRPGATVPMSGVYSVTVTVAGCTSAAGTTNVTVNPIPAAPTASSNSPVCAGQTINLFSNTVAGATYSWTGPGGFTSTLEDPTRPGATVAMSGVYSVTVTVAGCTSAAGTTNVTVNPTPAAPTASSNSPVCEGSTINLFSNTVAGATYSWTGPGGFTSALEDPTRPGATVAMSGVYSVTVTVAGCTSAAGTTNVTVNPIPAAPTASSNSPVCAGQTINLFSNTVAGATYSWTGPGGFTSTLEDPTRPGATVAMSGVYSVTVTVAGCTSAAGTTNVTVNPTPAAPTASSNSPVCEGSTINLFSNTVAGATYSWTGPGGFTSALEDPTRPGATVAMSGVYSVTVTVAGCTSAAGTTNVTVNPIPAAPTAGSNSPVCTGQTINLTASTIAGATYSWTGPGGYTSAVQNPTRPGATVAMSGVYSVTATVAGCTSVAGTVNVTVNPTPAAPVASNNGPLCEGQTLNLTASNVVGATYSWTGPGGFTSSTQNPSIPNVLVTNAGVYSVTVTVTGCTSAAATTTVTVNPLPAAPTAGSNSPLCTGQTLNLTASNIAGATYSWTGPNGFSSSSQNPSVANVTLADGGVYSVTATVNGCTGPAGTVNVVVSNTPVSPTASSNSPVCAGDTIQLTASFVAGATYSWTGPSGFTSTQQNPIITNAAVSNGGVYTVIVNNGCNSAPANTSVTVNPTPAAPTAGSNSPVCEGSTINLTASNIAGATYSWTGPNGFSSSLQNPSIAGSTTANSGVYSVTATVNGCTGPAGTVNVNVQVTPVAVAGSAQTVCANNGVVTLAGTSTTGSGQWTTSGNGTFGSATSLNTTYTPGSNDISSGTVTLTLTTTNNGPCASDNDQVVITITPAPTVNAGPNQTVCANNSVVTLSGSFTVSTGAVWTTSGDGTFAPSNISMNATYTPGTNDISAGTVNIQLTSTGNGNCLPVTDQMTITITPAPVVNAGPDDSTCINNPNAALTGTSTTGSGTWTTSGSGTFSPNANTLNCTYIPSASDLTGGSVVITLTSAANGNCIAVSDQMTLVFTQPPTVNAGPDQTVCGNNSATSLSGTSTTGSGIWSSSGSGTFSPAANNLNATYQPSATDISNGSVTLTLTSNNNGGCLAVTDQMIITITPAPTSNAGANQSVCANNANVSLSGSFTVSTGAQWSSSGSGTFSPDNISMNTTYVPSASDTANGSVTIYLTTTGNGNCLAVTDSMIITITNAPTVSAGTDTYSCLSSPNTPLNGSSSTGSGTWTTMGSGTFTPSANINNPTYNPSIADTTAGSVNVIFTSTNNGGCNSVSDTMTIFFTPIPTVNAGADQTVCGNNAVVSLNGTSSSGSGIWTTSGSGTFAPSATTLNATYTPSTADTASGSVTLTLTATNACVGTTDNLVITITDAPYVNAGADAQACSNNPNVTLAGMVSAGASTGAWSTSGDGSFNPSNTDMNATYVPGSLDTSNGSATIVLTSTGNGNCLAVTDTMVIIYTTPPVAQAGPDLNGCANNAIGLSGTIVNGNGTGIWTTTNGSGTFSNATDLSGSYTPVNADTSATPIVIILTSTNNGGCLASSDTLLIDVVPGPQVSAGADQVLCSNNAVVTINGSVINAGGVVWGTTGAGSFADSSQSSTTYTPDTSDISAGSVTLYITSTGNGSCTAVTDSMLVTFTPSPLVNAGAPIFICTGDMTASLNGSVSGATTTGIWTTSGSGTFTPSNTDLSGTYNLSAADTTAGSITLYLTSTNNGNCLSEMDSVVVTITTIPTVDAGNDTTACANATISLNGTVTGGGGTGYWSTNGDGTFAPDSSVLNGSYQPGPNDMAAGSVTLTLTPTNSCQVIIDSIVVTLTPAPQANAGSSQTICGGEIVNLNGSVSVATGGQWTTSGDGMFVPTDTTLNGVYIPGTNDVSSGSVDLTLITTGNGFCAADSSTITINIDSKPVAQFVTSTACVNSGVQFTDSSTIQNGTITFWYWTINGDTSTQQNPVYIFTSTGSFSAELIVSSGGGCSDTVQAQINVNPVPQVSYTFETFCPDSANFTATADMTIASWLWNFGDSTTSSIQNATHTYPVTDSSYITTVTVATDSGCVASFTDTVSVEACADDDVFGPAVPTAFTPNGDGANDVFMVRGGPFLEFELRVFNEWGNQIYYSTDQAEGWDGKYKNKKQPLGTYVWTYRIVTLDNTELTNKGEVTILK
ncbi:MAG: PKD domain-containing protein [Bacteroidota bacterium]